MKAIRLATCLFLALTTGSASAAFVDVDVYAAAHSSSGGGLATGLNFSAGDTITGSVDPNDLWNAGALPRWSNADGLTGDLFATGTDDSGQAAGVQIGRAFSNYTSGGFTAPYGTLVGSINSTFFVLGTSFNLVSPETGELFLYYWDSNSADNSGFITASIDNGLSVAPVPLPGGLLLLFSGLAGMAGLRGRRHLLIRPKR